MDLGKTTKNAVQQGCVSLRPSQSQTLLEMFSLMTLNSTLQGDCTGVVVPANKMRKAQVQLVSDRPGHWGSPCAEYLPAHLFIRTELPREHQALPRYLLQQLKRHEHLLGLVCVRVWGSWG